MDRDARVAALIERAKTWTPYERELVLQRFERAISRIRPKVTRRVLRGGCVVLRQARR